MKLPSSFHRFLRKVTRYVGPVGAGTVLRGCPCPPAEFHQPQPFTSSLAVDADTTLDATPASWETYCTEMCGTGSSQCFVRVNTSEGNSLPVTHACNDTSYGSEPINGSSSPWTSLCTKTCGAEQDCLIGPDRNQNNKVIINCQSWWTDCAGGRSTDGIELLPPMSEDGLGPALAHMAIREAESVFAFQRLARELGAHGAPRKLRKQAARSRRDEQRHARTMTSLARRFGTTMAPPVAPEKPLPTRSLDDVALENAVEGCVREAYGTWIAWKRAHDTRDPELRATMRRLAMDEARHAALAWNIHRWVMPRLDKKTRDRINQAMEKAWAEIAKRYPESEDLEAVKRGLAVC
jgi:rubrerythrin